MAYDQLIERDKELERIHTHWLSLQALCQAKKDAKECYCETFNQYIAIYDSRPMNERKPIDCGTCILRQAENLDLGDYTDRLRKKWIEEWKD